MTPSQKTAPPPAAPALTQVCPGCGELNAAPYLFCAHCGLPRFKPGRWRITIDMTLAFTAMMSTFYFKDDIGWSWPLYLLYTLLLMQFILAMAAGRTGLSLRLLGWYALFMTGAAALWTMHHMDRIDFLTHMIGEAPSMATDAALDYPLVFYPCLLIVLVLIFLPSYLRWGRLYGWVNAYRVLILAWLAIFLAPLGLYRIAEAVHYRGAFTELEPYLGDLVKNNQTTAVILAEVALTLMRVFFIEVCTFAVLQSYGKARRVTRQENSAAAQSPLVHASEALAGIARLIGQTFEQTVHYLLDTLRKLAIDLSQVILTFLRELFIPTLAMIGVGVLLHTLAEATRDYIELNQFADFLHMAAAGMGVLLCALIFLACKSHAGFRRIADFYFQLVALLTPNMMLFFLLLSVCLWATSYVLNGHSDGDELVMPFRIGVLTYVDAAVMALMVIIVLARKKPQAAPATAGSIAVATTSAAEAIAQSAAPHARAQRAPIIDKPAEPDAESVTEPPAQPPGSAPAAKQGWFGGAPKNADESEEPPKPGLLARAGAKLTPSEETRAKAQEMLGRAGAALTPSAEVRSQVRSKVQGLKNMAAGKPPVIASLAKIRAQIDEGESQLQALETMRGTISPETFETMHRTTLDEVNDLRAERDAMQMTVNQRYQFELGQLETHQTRVNSLKQKVGEYKRLDEMGIGGKTTKDQMAKVKGDLDVAESKLEQNQRNIAWYMEVADTSPGVMEQ